MLRRCLCLSLLLSLFILGGCSSLPTGGGRVSFELRDFEELKLKNGMTVLMIKDTALPYFSMMMLVPSGSANDPKGQYGVAQFVGAMLERGTAKRDALTLAENMERMGVNFNVSVGYDYTTISSSGLSRNRDQMIRDFAEVVTQPAFNAREIERVRTESLAGLTQMVDSPSAIASRGIGTFLYGDHPYGHSPSGVSRDVRSLRKKNIIRYYLEHYRPNRAIMAVVGDLPADLKSQLETSFGGWEGREAQPLKAGELVKNPGLQVEVIDKNDLQQTEIRIGAMGIERTDPDFLALRLANEILGGGFSSRLMQKVRKEKGLTYGVRSEFDARKFQGPFLVSTFTRHDKVGETIATILEMLRDFKKSGVTQEELMTTKAYLKGIFPQALETSEKLAYNLVLLRFYGISDNYLRNYLRDLDRLDLNTVNKAIAKHLDVENLRVLVYTSQAKTLPQVKAATGAGAKIQTKSYRDFL